VTFFEAAIFSNKQQNSSNGSASERLVAFNVERDQPSRDGPGFALGTLSESVAIAEERISNPSEKKSR